MGSFFHGWRRKAGVVALLMTCVFAVGWVRSVRQVDFIDVVNKRDLYFFFSGGQKFYFASNVAVSHPVGPAEVRKFTLHPLQDKREEFPLEWRHRTWASSGMLIYTGDIPKPIILIPYWFIVVPLTLLSCWLLLPRPLQRSIVPAENATVTDA